MNVTSPISNMLSVIIVTYNQAKYISAAITSVINQECDEAIEVIIIDDCSSDETSSKCVYFASRHSAIKYLKNEINVGGCVSFAKGLSIARGRYIALCEGDDYWVDSRKLQKQKNILDNHLGAMAVYSGFVTVNSDDEVIVKTHRGYKRNLTQADIFKGAVAHTLTLMFRRNAWPSNPPCQFLAGNYCDKYLCAIILEKGYAYFMEDITAAYRVSTAGVYCGLDECARSRELIKMYIAMYDGYRLCRQKRKSLKHTIAKEYGKMLISSLRNRQLLIFWVYSRNIQQYNKNNRRHVVELLLVVTSIAFYRVVLKSVLSSVKHRLWS